MAVLKVNGHARAAIVALAMLAATAQVARAETTTLVCPAITPSWPTLEIDLNEAQGTAIVNWQAVDTRMGKVIPARSQGPFAASFNSKSITFASPDARFEINRLTGKLVLVQSDGFTTQWDCHVGKAQF